MSYLTMNVDVDIDMDDIISDMSRQDRRYFFEAMQESGYIDDTLTITADGEVTLSSKQSTNSLSENFDKSVSKLIGNSWRLSKEDEETILKIANKLV